MRHFTTQTAFAKMVDDAKTRIKEVSVDKLRERAAANGKLVLIDVREDSEWS